MNKKQKIIMKFKDSNFVEHLLSAVLKSGQVKVGKLGIFEIRRINPRVSHSIRNNVPVTIPAYNKLVFKPSASVKRLIREYNAENN